MLSADVGVYGFADIKPILPEETLGEVCRMHVTIKPAGL
jgi:hypothetical protein